MSLSRRTLLARLLAGASGLTLGLSARGQSELATSSLDAILEEARSLPLGEVLRFHEEKRPHRVRVKMPPDAFPIASDYRSRYGITGSSRADSEYKLGVITSARALHNGIDILAPRGCPVIAVADGVATARTAPIGGNIVITVHEIKSKRLTYRSMGAHLDQVFVGKNQPVKRDDVIGTVGNSGLGGTKIPHLHFEVGDCCRHINPHSRWYRGVGRVTLYRPGERYDRRPERFVYPLPGLNDLPRYFSAEVVIERLTHQ